LFCSLYVWVSLIIETLTKLATMNQDKKKYFGISNRPYKTTDSKYKEQIAQTSNYLLSRFKSELIDLDAHILLSPDVGKAGESEYVEGKLVFCFEKDEYLQDITKTTEMIIDELGAYMIGSIINRLTPLEWFRLRDEFRKYFKVFCIEKNLGQDMGDEQIIEEVSNELDYERDDYCAFRLETLFANHKEEVLSVVST